MGIPIAKIKFAAHPLQNFIVMTRKKKLLLAVVVLLLLAQVVRPERTNPPVTGEIQADAATMAILERACYDCHSNETKWPWYVNVAPGSWLMARDVNNARDRMNFSEWDSYSEEDQVDNIRVAWEMVERNWMPMLVYKPLHPEAKITDEDKAVITAWAEKALGEKMVLREL